MYRIEVFEYGMAEFGPINIVCKTESLETAKQILLLELISFGKGYYGYILNDRNEGILMVDFPNE